MSYVHLISEDTSTHRHERASEGRFRNIVQALEEGLNFYSSRIDDLFKNAKARLHCSEAIIPDNLALPFVRRLHIIRANLKRILDLRDDDPSANLAVQVRMKLHPDYKPPRFDS